MPRESHTAGDRFPATRWSVLEAARSQDPAERARGLDVLCAAYWKPLYKYIRLRWNRPAQNAQDLTQGFFAELLERGLLAKYEPAKSRLRTYLRLCADSFVFNEHKAANRHKRGGNATHLALDFLAAEGELQRVAIDAASIPSPESLEQFFEKEWIRSLFTLAVQDLRDLCRARRREQTFLIFEAYDLADDGDTSYEELARKFSIPVTDVTNALAWGRREFRNLALNRLHEICGSEDEFQREVRAVFGSEAPGHEPGKR